MYCHHNALIEAQTNFNDIWIMRQAYRDKQMFKVLFCLTINAATELNKYLFLQRI